MYEIKQISGLQNMGSNMSYIVALQGYDDEVHRFCKEQYQKAVSNGCIIQEKLQNPDGNQIGYFTETIGSEFRLDKMFLQSQLRKWLTRLQLGQVTLLSDAMFHVLQKLQRMGKNESVLKNAYVKFMCWLYYRFSSVLQRLGTGPFIVLYEGQLSNYEYYMLVTLAYCGGQIVILDYGKMTQNYADFEPAFIQKANVPFPDTMRIKAYKSEFLTEQRMQQMLGRKSSLKPCVNAWLPDVNVDHVCDIHRVEDTMTLCSMFYRMDGVENRNEYQNQLFERYETVKATRPVVILESDIPVPLPQDMSFIKRQTVTTKLDILQTVVSSMNCLNADMNQYAKWWLQDVIQTSQEAVARLNTKILLYLVYLYKYSDLILHHGCIFGLEKTCFKESTWDVLRMLSEFGVDVIVYNPSKLTDTYQPDTLLVQTFDETILLDAFPKEKSQAVLSTTAYHAERDLDQMLYQDTGMYRERQYKRADAVVLRTMYEEIEVLWNEPVNLRTGFEIKDNSVVVPVLYAKVMGVKNGNRKLYMKSIEKLVTGNENCYLMKEHMPFRSLSEEQSSGMSYGRLVQYHYNDNWKRDQSDVTVNIASILSNRKVDVTKVKACPYFKYNYLQDDTIAFMCEKLDALLWSGIFAGVGKDGTENVLFEMFLTLPKEIVNLIQKFDFTKVNPKLVYVNGSEQVMTLKDSMCVQYLSMLGFDVVLFIPTGYNVVDTHVTKQLYVEHQLGEYLYDLSMNVKRKKGFFG